MEMSSADTKKEGSKKVRRVRSVTNVLSRKMTPQEREALEAEGFKFLGPVEGDDLFQYVVFPEGWTKRRTEHHMYTDLVDPQSRTRGSIGYKVAFYDDRWANFSLYCRYTVGYEEGAHTVADRGTPVEGENYGKVLHRVPFARKADGGVKDYDEYEASRKACTDWLAEHYPNWQDPTSYWND
jgi:hypothetical protein